MYESYGVYARVEVRRSRTSYGGRALILESNGGNNTSEERKDQSLKLQLVALVLSIVRLMVELL